MTESLEGIAQLTKRNANETLVCLIVKLQEKRYSGHEVLKSEITILIQAWNKVVDEKRENGADSMNIEGWILRE